MKSVVYAAWLLAAGSAASAATVQFNSDGRITGATDVRVGGASYNVELAERGNCEQLFSGCDEFSDFAFQTPETALVAAQALIDQVFVRPYADLNLIAGMDHAAQIWTPFAPIGWGYPEYASDEEAVPIIITNNQFKSFVASVSSDFCVPCMIDETYTQWTPIAAVPVPGSLVLLATALAGLGLARRKMTS